MVCTDVVQQEAATKSQSSRQANRHRLKFHYLSSTVCPSVSVSLRSKGVQPKNMSSAVQLAPAVFCMLSHELAAPCKHRQLCLLPGQQHEHSCSNTMPALPLLNRLCRMTAARNATALACSAIGRKLYKHQVESWNRTVSQKHALYTALEGLEQCFLCCHTGTLQTQLDTSWSVHTIKASSVQTCCY